MFTSSVAKTEPAKNGANFCRKNCKTAGDGQRDEKSGIEKLAGFFFFCPEQDGWQHCGRESSGFRHKLRNSQEHKWEKISW